MSGNTEFIYRLREHHLRVTNDAADIIEALEAQLAAAKQAQPERAPSDAIDAKRYRYWRENHGWTGYFDDGATNSESNDDVDKAIDAAIKQGGQHD